MISEHDALRIRDDARIACDALQSLICAAPYISERYVKEKLRVVKGCVKFIENFEEEQEDEVR
jgi:hypothetical protein